MNAMGSKFAAGYEASTLNIGRINRYAAKVARELGGTDHVLETRFWRRTDKIGRNGDYEKRSDDIYYSLLGDGSLVVQVRHEEEVVIDGRYHLRDPGNESTRPFAENDYLLFDCKAKYEIFRGKTTVETDRERGALIHHAKGVGISLRLKRLLESRRSL
jgi:hypothetical protein